MGKLFKFLIGLLVLVLVIVVAYAYLAPLLGIEFKAPQSEIRLPVELDAD